MQTFRSLDENDEIEKFCEERIPNMTFQNLRQNKSCTTSNFLAQITSDDREQTKPQGQQKSVAASESFEKHAT